jgi:cyclopropane fatty-acyl-phospholipid synthase-like methyltransferase
MTKFDNGSIWKPQYDICEDFRKRTQRALENKNNKSLRPGSFLQDADPSTLYKEAVSWFNSMLTNKPSVLEVGCGYGRWACVLKDSYSSYDGVDITKARIDYARQEYPEASFHLIESCNWSIGRKFDVVFSVSCLQHLKMQDAIDTLQTMRDHLKPEGVILLHEARMEFTTEKEAEEIYKQNCPAHMIQKPISLFEQHVDLTWEEVECSKKHHHQFILKPRL